MTKSSHYAKIQAVNVINLRNLMEGARRHPQTVDQIRRWYKLALRARWKSLVDVRATFSGADQAGSVLIFNISGQYRLVLAVNYEKQHLNYRGLFTHAEYDRLNVEDRWE